VADTRFEVPGFPDPDLLRTLVQRVRLRRLNGLVITGLLAIVFAGFLGWTFSAKKYLEKQTWCDNDSVGMKSGHQLCLKREAELIADGVSSPNMHCDMASETTSAFDYCMEEAGTNEAKQFGMGAAGIAGFGLLLIAIGVTWRIVDKPKFVDMLRDPTRIAWIYESSTISGRYGMWHGVVIALESPKERIEIPVAEGTPDFAYSLRVMAALSRWAPAATIGYSPEKEARWLGRAA
jgi:hypothetical protein